MRSRGLPKSAPEAPKSLPGGLWATFGGPSGGPSGLERFWVGSWRLLGLSRRALGTFRGRSWRLFGRLGPARRLREAILVFFFDGPAPEAEQPTTNYVFLIFEGFLDRVLALNFAFFLLAWHASGEAANIETS